MRIDFIEIQNFRKLKSTRIDFDDMRTLFVGPNNSGKTSAMVALRTFLLKPGALTLKDISICNWSKIDAIGKDWEEGVDAQDLGEILPALDIWFDVPLSEIHRVIHVVPTLNWSGGSLGVRFQYAPSDIENLKEEYLTARSEALETESKVSEGEAKPVIKPQCLTEFLEMQNLKSLVLDAYPLDPDNQSPPESNGHANPQSLPSNALKLDKQPFDGLIVIEEIAAQRDLSDANANFQTDNDSKSISQKNSLSDQIRSYYDKHLENSKEISENDLIALAAIQSAETAFDDKLKLGFKDALDELAVLGVPGINNPSIVFNTQLKAAEGLKHSAAIQYRVSKHLPDVNEKHYLPESYAGLGYQNLISMIFRLMRFRQDLIALRDNQDDPRKKPLLHLVLVEEPEAHLHAQVQQVFINKAYDVLRNHEDLEEKTECLTQLIVSTHSSHVAHEVDFKNLRYFRRHLASDPGDAPTTTVANLSNTFGSDVQTYRFVKRYLKATDCDLFFADAAIFVEGQAERILVPHFIRYHHPNLWKRYTSLIDQGGAHAHTFEPLIRDLGLTTLVISDLDAALPTEITDKAGNKKTVSKAAKPQIGGGQISSNNVLKKWHPKLVELDDLLELSAASHSTEVNGNYCLYVAYQKPVSDPSNLEGGEVVPRTFEDALIYENYEELKDVSGSSVTNKIAKIVDGNTSGPALEQELFDLLKTANKASFAIDCLGMFEDDKTLRPPPYIKLGLEWLETQLDETNNQTLV